MATRYVTYKYSGGRYATYDRYTEQVQIDEVEAAAEYIDKADVNLDERKTIKDNLVRFDVSGGEFIAIDPIPDMLLVEPE